MSRYAHLILWAAVLAAFYGLARPGSMAGHAVTAVASSLSNVLSQAGA